MIPFERSIYVTLLTDFIEKENAKVEEQERSMSRR